MNKTFWVIILLFSTSLIAEEDFDKLLSMTLEELLQIKITGSTLTRESRLAVPSAVTVFTHKEIERMGFDYLDELANLVPGFQSYRMAGTPLQYPISSRGRRIGVVAAEILVMVDGQRLDGPRSSGMAIVLPKFSLKYIQRVEFIRGPSAAIYGSNAMMGIINIVTRSNVNELSISYGSFNRRKLNLQASTQIGDFHLDLFSQIDADDGDNYRLPDTFSANFINTDDPREIDDLTIKLRWRDTQFSLLNSRFSAENFYELDLISNGFNQRHGRLSTLSVQQNFDWQTVKSWLRLGYNESKVNLTAQFTAPGALAAISTPTSNDALFANAEFNDYRERRLQWHNSLEIGVKSNLQFGLEIRHINAPETIAKNNFDLGDLADANFPIRYYGSLLPTTIVQSKSKRDILGLYAQFQHQLFESTQLTLGLRYDNFSNIGSQVSPRIGFVQELNEQHSFKLLYGEAFRAPSESELFLQNSPVLSGNPNLGPETVKSWDLIWVGQWSNTALSLGYFENHFTDAIVETPTDIGIPRYENVLQEPTKGFEFELSHQLNTHWLTRASYTNITEKPDLSHREADRIASLVANYQQGDWNTNLIATWYDKRELAAVDNNASRIVLDDSWVLYVKLSYNFNSDWQGFVQIKNLSDKSYNSPTLGASLAEGVANRGREILFGVNWKI